MIRYFIRNRSKGLLSLENEVGCRVQGRPSTWILRLYEIMGAIPTVTPRSKNKFVYAL